MKQHLLLLLLCLLSCVSWAQETGIDSARWAIADRAMQEGHHEDACSLYIDLSGSTIATYQDINSRKVEDLRDKYSIDEVQLHKNFSEEQMQESDLQFDTQLDALSIRVDSGRYMKLLSSVLSVPQGYAGMAWVNIWKRSRAATGYWKSVVLKQSLSLILYKEC